MKRTIAKHALFDELLIGGILDGLVKGDPFEEAGLDGERLVEIDLVFTISPSSILDLVAVDASPSMSPSVWEREIRPEIIQSFVDLGNDRAVIGRASSRSGASGNGRSRNRRT